MNKFIKTELGHVVQFSNGKAIKPGGSGIFTAYGSNGIIGGSENYNHKNAVILGRVGAYCGSVAYSRKKFWASDNTIIVYPKIGFNIEYIYYLLINLKLNRFAGGSAQPLLTQTVLKQVPAIVPSSIRQQNKIVQILSAYDRLIENNARRIKILKEMAQNLYREWFVNFRFPGHEQTKLVDSGTDLGQIPEGWKICNLGDLVSFKTGKLNANAAKPNGEYPFFTCSQEIYRTDTYSFDTECILLAGNNANGVFHIKFFNGKFDAYQRTYVIQSLNSKINSNHYFFFAISSQLERLKSLSTGAATKFLTLTILNNVKILISDPYTQSSFRKFASTFFDQIDTLKSKNENLTKTRDLLLPKLISGEIDVESLNMDKEAIAA
jgi:type I restriction enzyme, S subunit